LELDTNDTLPVTAIKQSEDGQGIILRLFNPSEEPATGAIRSSFKIERARYVTLGEEPKKEIPVSDPHTVLLAAKQKQIVTVRLDIQRSSKPLPSPLPRVHIVDSETLGPADSHAFESGSDLLTDELAREEDRATALEMMLQDKQAGGQVEDMPDTLAVQKHKLEVETLRRTTLEARLSATLLKKKILLHSQNSTTEKRLVQLEATLQEIGNSLNASRIRKRALEYIVDYYANAAQFH
jgi:hypothetical protein